MLSVMKEPDFQKIIKKFPKKQQGAILATIAAAESLFPKATRAIAWNMPTLKIGEDNLCHVMGFKSHNSLFPASGAVAQHMKKELAKYKVSKGTIQFDLTKPFPKPLLKKILLTRLQEINSSYPKANGKYIQYYKNGGVQSIGKYKAGKMNGAWSFYRTDGSVMRTGSFKNGKQTGTWTTFDAKGRIVKKTQF